MGTTSGGVVFQPAALVSVASLKLTTRRALEQAEVEFIDVDKGGPGVRLRVPPTA